VAGARILLFEQVRDGCWCWYGMTARGGKNGGDAGWHDHQIYLASAIFAHPVLADNFVGFCFADVQFQQPPARCKAVMLSECRGTSAGGHLRIGGETVKDARVRPQAASMSARGQQPAPRRVVDSGVGHSCQQPQDPVAHPSVRNQAGDGRAVITFWLRGQIRGRS
jgi:hypothetical protein